jgi:hypothetical protein
LPGLVVPAGPAPRVTIRLPQTVLPHRACEDPMPPKLKTALFWIVAIFLVYAIVTSPDRAADMVRALWDIIVSAFTSFGRFFSNLTE